MPGSAQPSTSASSYGRYVVLRDRDGRRHAVARHAVSSVCEIEEGGCALVLPGGRVIVLLDDLDAVLLQLA